MVVELILFKNCLSIKKSDERERERERERETDRQTDRQRHRDVKAAKVMFKQIDRQIGKLI